MRDALLLCYNARPQLSQFNPFGFRTTMGQRLAAGETEPERFISSPHEHLPLHGATLGTVSTFAFVFPGDHILAIRAEPVGEWGDFFVYCPSHPNLAALNTLVHSQ